jgi:hypothetical protein
VVVDSEDCWLWWPLEEVAEIALAASLVPFVAVLEASDASLLLLLLAMHIFSLLHCCCVVVEENFSVRRVNAVCTPFKKS